MSYSICTLFEGHYHYGVGALVNSLFASNFVGDIWVGYRGTLPPWATPLQSIDEHLKVFCPTPSINLRFIRINTDRHLTNYKPDFMLQIFDAMSTECKGLMYIDPDIIVKAPWQFFEEWADCGVALCQDMNGFMPDSHPTRHVWRKDFANSTMRLSRVSDSYVNGGYVGVSRESIGFLHCWSSILMTLSTRFDITGSLRVHDRLFPYHFPDQDGLNIAAMEASYPISIIGKESMDFTSIGSIMSHAAGNTKPWRRNYVQSALCGAPPSTADKAFWKHTQTPVQLYSKHALFINRLLLAMGSILGRFIRRS